VTILDNELPTVDFSTNQDVIPEGGNLANVIVKLNGPSAQTIQVYYATTNGTATADLDYVDTNGRLTFVPGQTAASFRVLILQDSLGELNETILMRLTDPVNASLGTPVTSTLVILDDDPPSATFTQSDYEIIESGGSASIEVALTKPFDQIVIVDYDLSSGTALAGSDFFDLPGNLLFSPGQTNKSFSVNLINDSLPEDPETVLLSLTGFFNATAGPQINALLTIEDDDTLRLSEPALTAEGFFRMRITGQINQVLDIESSVNATNWIFRESLTNLTGITTYIDREITNQMPRFYRATAP
jgi:hypothetical protein